MARKLTNAITSINESSSGSILTHRASKKFKLCIEQCLDNKFSFCTLKQKDLKELDYFIKETVGKQLSISEVEKLFLRKKGPVFSHEIINGQEREIIHFGKDRKPFRIHGYYNKDGYFVIHQIDPNHKKHKS